MLVVSKFWIANYNIFIHSLIRYTTPVNHNHGACVVTNFEENNPYLFLFGGWTESIERLSLANSSSVLTNNGHFVDTSNWNLLDGPDTFGYSNYSCYPACYEEYNIWW